MAHPDSENPMTTRPVAESEVQRILALIPWILAHPGTPKSEIADRFGITHDQLESDLRLVLMVGIPPYSPGEYIDVDDFDGTVTLRLADYFRRPLRLSAPEGLTLLAAGRALLAVPGSENTGPLAMALEKLAIALDAPDLSVEVNAPEYLEDVRTATERREKLQIEYWSAGRGKQTARTIEPWVTFFAVGAWYVHAWCHKADAERSFRVDRIRHVSFTGEQFEDPFPSTPTAEVYQPDPHTPRVTLLLSPEAFWVLEELPIEEVGVEEDGRRRVVLAVSEPAFLERLLVRLGSGSEVVAPDEFRALSARTAERILDRYGGKPTDRRPSGRS